MKKLLTIILGVGIMITVFAFSHIMSTKRMEHKELPQAKLKDEYLKKEMFTIMLNDGTGNYEASENSEFPKDGYVLNETKSGCINREGKEVKDVISYNSLNKTIGIRTKEEVYCYLYYDIAEIAGEFTFYIKDNTEDNYTKEKTNTGYLSWEADGITSYCISESDDVKNCSEWTNVSNVKSANKEYTFTNETNEEKIVYAYIKNNSGVTKQASDKIGYDTVAPVVSSFSLTGTAASTSLASSYTNSRNIKGSIQGSDNLSGKYMYCISTSSSTCNGTWSSSSSNISYTISSGNGTKTLYAFIKDKAENISKYVAGVTNKSIILDTTNPIINSDDFTLEKTSSTQITATISQVTEDNIYQYCFRNGTSSGYSCSSSNTKSFTVTAGQSYTIFVYVVDKAGNNSSTLNDTISIELPTALDLVNMKPNNLTSEPVGGLHRYQGTNDVNNYICLGTNCTEFSDDMYRIIGIAPDGQIKVIKKTAMKDGETRTFPWHTTYVTDTQWPDSDLFHRLNDNKIGETYATSSFYYKLDSALKSHIDDEHLWNYGDTTSRGSYNGLTMYDIESKFNNTIEAPIGLMYIYDYLLAYPGGNPVSNTNALDTWISYEKNDNVYSSSWYEWTMTRYGKIVVDDAYCANTLNFFGNIANNRTYLSQASRPVFYLKSDITLSGAGTLSNPYKIV